MYTLDMTTSEWHGGDSTETPWNYTPTPNTPNHKQRITGYEPIYPTKRNIPVSVVIDLCNDGTDISDCDPNALESRINHH